MIILSIIFSNKKPQTTRKVSQNYNKNNKHKKLGKLLVQVNKLFEPSNEFTFFKVIRYFNKSCQS